MSNTNTDYRIHREDVYKRDGHKCVYCGRKDLLTLDHLVPISKGGDRFAEDNLVTACLYCNNAKGDMMPLEWLVQKDQVLERYFKEPLKKAS